MAAAPDPWTRLREARTTLRDGGPHALVIKTLQELQLYRRLELVDIPLGPRPMEIVPRAPGLAARELACAAADLAAYADFRPDVPPGVARDRLQRGERCYVAEQNGEILSAVWTTPGPVRLDYLQCVVQIAAPDCYGYDSFTCASRRGEDLASLRSELMKECMRTAGCRRLIATQLPENTNQRRRAQRFGYRPLGVVGWVGIGPWRRIFVRQRPDLDVPIGLRIVVPRS